MSYKKALMGLMVILCLTCNCIAQSLLKPGDALPEQVFNTIKAQKGRPLLISECNTLCRDCIKMFMRMQRLKEQYNGQLQLIAVVRESKPLLNEYLNRTTSGKLIDIITDDSVMYKYFPYRYVSHNIWVGSDGVIKAISGGEFVDTLHLNALLQNKLSLPLKDDFVEFNNEESLIKQDNVSFYTVVTGYRQNIKPRYGFDTTDNAVRMYFINYPLVKLYLAVYGHALFFPANRIIIEAANTSDYIYNPSEGSIDRWNQKHSYGYEQLMPLTVSKKRRLDALIATLNVYFNINGRMEKKLMPCHVLKCINTKLVKEGTGDYINTLGKSGAKTLRNGKIATLIWELNKQSPVPVLDETGITTKVNLDLGDTNLQHVETLNQAFAAYGLILEKTERLIEVFVLTEKNKSYE